MIVKSVRLHPFAGIHDRTFNFKKGLNVLSGPNEAGKSTLFNAILHCLLSSTSKTARQLEDEMGHLFPAGGGDVIRVEMQITTEDGTTVNIHKTWKKGNRQGSASLIIGDGTEVSSEEDVQEHINSILPVSVATVRSVLLSDQSGLQETLKRIRQDDDVRSELGSVLRKSVMETGGVSIDRFRKLIDDKYDEYFKRWDRGQQYPENNRGVKNPYKTGLGRVLAAFYAMENLRIGYESAFEFEKRLDELNSDIGRLTQQLEDIETEYKVLSPLKKGIQQRQGKENELFLIEQELNRLRKINRDWLLFEERIKQSSKEIEDHEAGITALEEELKKVNSLQELKKLKERVERLEGLKKTCNDLNDELDILPCITEDQLGNLRELKGEIDRLETQVEAAKLTVSVESESDLSLEWQEISREDAETIELKSGKEISRTASGGFTVKSKELKLSVFSGEGNIEKIAEELKEKRDDFNKELESAGADNLSMAEAIERAYREKNNEYQHAQKRLKEELGDDDIESIKQKLKDTAPEIEGIRDLATISKELTDKKSEKTLLAAEISEKKDNLAEWKDEFDDHESVADALGKCQYEYSQLKNEIDALPDLPDQFQSADEFLQHLESMESEIKEIRDVLHERKELRALEQGKAPETSSEELKLQMEEAEEEFERVNREAELLARVRDKAGELLCELDEDTFSGLERSFVSWLAVVTGDRFKSVKMDNDSPEIFVTDEDRELAFHLLSHGTRGSVALAWRFALCDHLVNSKPCFIVLDDPLVDMDPGRRKKAVEGIMKFAKTNQVLVMTCHPEHEKIIKRGNRIKIT